MRPNINTLIKVFASYFPLLEPIVEIGAYQVPGQEKIAELRHFFPEKKYLGCDMRFGKGVDQIENVEHLSFKNNSVGTLIMAETMEHVQKPWLAFDEAFRVLKPKGFIIATSVFYFPIHDHPYDYWRFTPEVLAFLMQKFPQKVIGWQGIPNRPHTVFGIGYKGKNENMSGKFKKAMIEFEKEIADLPKLSIHDKLWRLRHETRKELRRLLEEKEEIEWKLI